MTGYAGDLEPKDAWNLMERESRAVMVDVRTRAEWAFVGLPDLSPVGRQIQLVEWQRFPDMARNAVFEDEVRAALSELGADKDAPVLFLCRSGQRSRMAAMAMTAAGFGACYNVASGFEGDMDGARRRGQINGWKASGLPWFQQ
ncbi:MAG: rhodanese-like domain-containing protein [Sphingomonadales bacterium]